MASVATSIIFEEQIEVPLTIAHWTTSVNGRCPTNFPETGRIDFIAGKIEVDMAPEEFFCHGGVKTEFARVLSHRVKRQRLGHLQIDRTRISCPQADLSVEPDIVFISYETLESGLARLVPKAGHHADRYIEVEGIGRPRRRNRQ